MSVHTPRIPNLQQPPFEVFTMNVEAMAQAAEHAGHLAVTFFDVEIPKGVSPAQVVRDAALAVPVLWAIAHGEPVSPADIQPHIDRATTLQAQLQGSELPLNILGPVSAALGAAAGASAAEAPEIIRQAMRSPNVQASLAVADPYLRAAERFDVGPQLGAELGAVAERIRNVARANSAGGRTSPEVLAQSIYSAANEIVAGAAPLPMLREFLNTYASRSGATLSLPPYERIAKYLETAGPAIMEAVDAALPPDQRDADFLDSMGTTKLAKAGKLTGNGDLRAIRKNVGPLLTELVAMMPRDPVLARQQLHALFSAV